MKRRASNKKQGTSRAKKTKQKDSDGPRRPLSAYNIYFKLVRPVLIETYERGDKQADFRMLSLLERPKHKGPYFKLLRE